MPFGRSMRSTRKTKPSSVVSPISVYRPRATCEKNSWRADGHGAVGLAVFLVDVDEVDVGGDVELARAELAHADHPELDVAAALAARQAVAHGLVGDRLGEREIERGLGELGHGQG